MDYICDVIVLTWNKKDLIKNFLESFLETTVIPCRLIIIDNGSKDETVEYLKNIEKFSFNPHKVEIIFNSENLGFVRGMNQGISKSLAKYVCLANNDLIFNKDWLTEILKVFDKYPDLGILNPNSNNLGAKPHQGQSVSEFAKFLRLKDQDTFVELPFCIGFCMVIKREIIDKVGGLSDEFYPMFFEDTDYSLKVQKAGYRIGVAVKSYVWHIEHESIKELANNKKERIFSRSREKFFNKWGKILRIGWILNEKKYLVKEDLEKAIDLARQGNYIWFFTKEKVVKREDIFKRFRVTQHSGIQFIEVSNLLILLWRLLTKKKKYDLLIVPDKLFNLISFLKFIHKAELISINNLPDIQAIISRHKLKPQLDIFQ